MSEIQLKPGWLARVFKRVQENSDDLPEWVGGTGKTIADLRRQLAEARQAILDSRVSREHQIANVRAELHTIIDGLASERDTLRAQLAERERELALAHSLLRAESQLACDLRSTQDEIIERCAAAVEEWPEAAARLREHCASSENTAISGEDFGELRRELAEAKAEIKRLEAEHE